MDIFKETTDRILELLKEGIVPWKCPWQKYYFKNGRRMLYKESNYETKRPYEGINQWLLRSNYKSPFWLTEEQIIKKDLRLKPGAKCRKVYFVKDWENKVKKRFLKYEYDETDFGAFCKIYNVFNTDQIENLNLSDEELGISPVEESRFDNIELCESVVEGYKDKPLINHGVAKAFYNINDDVINMPVKNSFFTPESYYSVLFHEMIHSTGAEKRLNRKGIRKFDRFGSHQYSYEELIAEFGASYLSALTGIQQKTIVNSASYIDSWSSAFRKNPKMVYIAASEAENATNYILGENIEQGRSE